MSVPATIANMSRSMTKRSGSMKLTDRAKKFIIGKGSNTDFGARPLRRAIENYVEDPLSEELLKGEFQGKETILIDVKEVGGKKQLVFTGVTGEAAEDEAPVGAGAGGESGPPDQASE